MIREAVVFIHRELFQMDILISKTTNKNRTRKQYQKLHNSPQKGARKEKQEEMQGKRDMKKCTGK
jgi:hypothetical protein